MRRKRFLRAGVGLFSLAIALLLAGCGGSGGKAGSSSSAAAGGQAPPAGRIAFTRYATWDPESAVFEGAFITDPSGSSEQRITFPAGWKDLTVAWSPDGKELLVAGSLGKAESAIVRPDGTVVRSLPPKGLDAYLFCEAWAPDGKTVLCHADSDQHPSIEGVYSLRADGTGRARLTATPYHLVVGAKGDCGGGDSQESFSPDGKQFVFRRKRCGHGAEPWVHATAALYVENSDGSGLHKIVNYGGVRPHAGTVAWSPDGREILFGDDDGNLHTVHPDGSHPTEIFVDTSKFGGFAPYAFAPAWSPDGRWIVFTMGTATGQGLDGVRLWRSRPDGSHLAKIVAGHDGVAYASWSLAGA